MKGNTRREYTCEPRAPMVRHKREIIFQITEIFFFLNIARLRAKQHAHATTYLCREKGFRAATFGRVHDVDALSLFRNESFRHRLCHGSSSTFLLQYTLLPSKH